MSDLDLLHAIGRIGGEFRRRYHAEIEKSGYEGLKGNGRILYILDMNGEMSQKDLALRMHIRPQSLTGALLKLEEAGYITRRRSEKDKREQFVSVTQLGKERGREMRLVREQVATDLFECLDMEEKENFSGLVNKVISCFDVAVEE